MLWIGIAAALVVGVVGVVLTRGKDAGEAPPAAIESAPAAAEVTAPAPPPAAATTPAAAGRATAQPKPAAAAPAATAAAKPAATEPARPAPEPAAETPAKSEPAPSEAPPAAPAAATEPAPAEPAPEPASVAPEPVAALPRPAEPVAAPRAPSVREGELVALGPGVTPPVLVSVEKPAYPPLARRTKVEGTVVLALLVDENGRVVDVRVERGVSLNVGINEAAVAAARTARYRPATKDGVRVKTWHQLTIPFKL
jgi:TonB family protein